MISIIIPVKNGEATLPACLQAVLAQEGLKEPVEVIVVDDGSTDRSAEIARSLEVRVISQVNAGAAAARNCGAASAGGEILAFTDADCAPAPGWLAALTAPLARADVVGVKGVYATRQQEPAARFVQLEYEYKYRRMHALERIDFVDTYSAAYRADVFRANTGFDTRYPVPSVEDQEFSFRLAAKGYRLAFAPDAVVYHVHDRTPGEYARRKFGIGRWKTVLLHSHPSKLLKDTHTSPSQRWQILLLGMSAALGAAGLLAAMVGQSAAGNGLLLAALAAFVGFWITAAPFLNFILKRDRSLWLSPCLVLLRAAALGAGLVWGALKPSMPRVVDASGQAAAPGLAYHLAKRFADILVSVVGLVVLSPLLAFLCLLIRLDSPGPALFCHERSGENGRPFRMWKLRTMIDGAEDRLEHVLPQNPLQGAAFKIPTDPRITRVGRFLRRWSLDELPQLWNILKGEMSLVGPRPEECWVVAGYSDHDRLRLAVKPGLTGPMQVNGRGELSLPSRLELELAYIERPSLWEDLKIIAASVPAVLSGRGAY